MTKSDVGWLKTAGQLSSIALLIFVSTGIGLWSGIWLDGKLGTKPWLAFVLTVVGLASGIYETVRLLIQVSRDADK